MLATSQSAHTAEQDRIGQTFRRWAAAKLAEKKVAEAVPQPAPEQPAPVNTANSQAPAVPTATLTERDLAMFYRLGIGPDLLARVGVQRVSDREAREQFGVTGPKSRNMAGIAFPYYSHVTEQRVTARVRRDNPEIEDGKPKNKYVSAYGDGRHLYFLPDACSKLQEPTTPIVLVEAEKSVLALTAWARRTNTDVLPVGLGGCWGWRGRIGKADSASGERVDVLGPLADLDVCNKRRVYVLLDANAATNSRVRAARTALVRELHKRGCDVQVCELPIVEGVNGPDDFIATCGDDALVRVLDGTADANKNVRQEQPEASEKSDGKVDIIAAALENIEAGPTLRETFYRLCVTLQKLRGDEAVILPVQKIGAALECDWSLIARFRRQAVAEGWLKQVRRAIAHRQAAQFRVESFSGTPSTDKNRESISPPISNHSHSHFHGTPPNASLVGHPASPLVGHPQGKSFSGTPNPAESDNNELCEVIL